MKEREKTMKICHDIKKVKRFLLQKTVKNHESKAKQNGPIPGTALYGEPDQALLSSDVQWRGGGQQLQIPDQKKKKNESNQTKGDILKRHYDYSEIATTWTTELFGILN